MAITQSNVPIKAVATKGTDFQPALEFFLSFCRTRRYKKKTKVVTPGDPADKLHYIVEGSVSVLFEDEGGNELVLAYLNQGQFIGEMGLFLEQPPRSISVKTRTDCVLAEIGYAALRRLLNGPLRHHHVDLLLAIGTQLSQRLLKTSRQAGRLAFHDTRGRIARVLLDLCTEPEALTHPDGMQISVTRQELARIAGCSREVAGRVLKELEAQRLIWVKGKTIVVYGTR